MTDRTRRSLPTIDSGDSSRGGRARLRLPDGSKIDLERRDFLRLSAAASATAALGGGAAGCAAEPEHILPRTLRPEPVRIGQPLHYATTCLACPGGCGIVATTRQGRVVKVEGNAAHPLNRGVLCARGQATVLDLYDPDRIRKSLLQARGKQAPLSLSAEQLDARVVAALQRVQKTNRVRLLTGAMSGWAMRGLVKDFLAAFPGARHVAWEPLAALVQNRIQARRQAYGGGPRTGYDFYHHPERADLIVALGAEFLDAAPSSMQMAQAFGERRHPDAGGGMSKLWVFEGRMSLTGSNADRRFRVRPSQLGDVALALAHAILVEQRHGPLGAEPLLARHLAPFAPDAVATRTGVAVDALRDVARGLVEAAGKSLVIAGGSASSGDAGLRLELAVNLLNTALGNDGVTVDHDLPSYRHAADASLSELTEELRQGQVEVLIIHGTNPVFSAPPELGFAEALGHVGVVVVISDRVDETAQLADLVAAATHPLESWGDVEPALVLRGVVQPAMRPLGEMRSLGDWLAAWALTVDASGRLVQAKRATEPEGAVSSATYHYIREFWRREVHPAWAHGRDFETFFRDVLHSGFADWPPPERHAEEAPSFDPKALGGVKPAAAEPPPLELSLFASHALYDGRQANNGWLQEYPDPVTRITWDSWAGMSPARMRALELEDGDLCEVKAAGRTVTLPVVAVPGQHDAVVSVPLGNGRMAVGRVGNDVGANGFLLAATADRGSCYCGHAAEVTKLGGRRPLAVPQGEKVIDLSVRPLIPYTTLSAYRSEPSSGTERPAGEISIWPRYEYPDTRWGMAIDLSRCIGCGACTIACQAENNIPVAGRKGVINGREMHWLRVDRYYRMPVEPRRARTPEEVEQQRRLRAQAEADDAWLQNPEVLHHPLMCQHCENAPCETVCPVGATQHSSDGLNVQVYNRCVGTRYCSNNCPFKARRFNWFDYSADQVNLISRILQPGLKRISTLNHRWPLALKNNPEVTVRSRGVMEKCTFCVQRIAVGRGRAKDENRALRDGDVVPACAQTCPTRAIHFGNLSDPNSEVARLRGSPRGLTMLDEQKLGTSVTYLTKVRNDGR